MQNTHGRAKDVRFDLDRRALLGRGPRRPPRPRRRQPARQRPQVEPAGRAGARSTCREGAVVVHDHGPGIADGGPAAHLRPLLPLAAARGLPGSGLGLAIVAQVVKAEGGTILAENDPAGGARCPCACRRSPAAEDGKPGDDGRPLSDSSLLLIRSPICRSGAGRTLASVPAGGSESAARHRLRRRGGRTVPAGPSAYPRGRSVGGDELDPVAERVVDVGAAARLAIGVRPDRHPGRPAARLEVGQVVAPRRPGAPCGPAGSPPPRPGAPPRSPRRNQQPPRAASGAGLGTAFEPEQPRVEGLGPSSPPGGIASCTWSRPTISKPMAASSARPVADLAVGPPDR